MSVPPPGSGKKEVNPNIVVALIGAGATLAAAGIPIVSTIVKPPTPAVSSPAAPSDTGGNSLMGKTSTSDEIGANNLADKSAHYLILKPYDRSAGDTFTAVQDAYFRSPADSKKWIKLTITQHNHNQTVTLAGSDFKNQSRTTDISANNADEGDRTELKTGNFTIHSRIVEVKTGADSDTTAPLAGKVFEKLQLRIDCDDHS